MPGANVKISNFWMSRSIIKIIIPGMLVEVYKLLKTGIIDYI